MQGTNEISKQLMMLKTRIIFIHLFGRLYGNGFSTYPTVHMVTMAHQNPSGMLEMFLDLVSNRSA